MDFEISPIAIHRSLPNFSSLAVSVVTYFPDLEILRRKRLRGQVLFCFSLLISVGCCELDAKSKWY